MTHDEIRAEAIEAAKHARDVHGVPNSGCDDDLTFEECGGVCCILARCVLSLHDETPVDREALTDLMRRVLDNQTAIRTMGQLRMMEGIVASLPHAGETGVSE